MVKINLLDAFHFAFFHLAQLLLIVIDVLIGYGLLRYFKQNSYDGGLPNPTGPLPVFHHRPSYVYKGKSKWSLIKDPHDIHVHNSLSNI